MPIQSYRGKTLGGGVDLTTPPLGIRRVKLRLHDEIYRLRFHLNPLIHILSLSNSHNNVASIQKNPDDKSHGVIVA